MITYRKPLSLRDMLVRARIAQPTTTFMKGCNRPNTCKYCGKIFESGKVKNLSSDKTYNTVTNGSCQSNHLILFEIQLVPDQICRTNLKENLRYIPRSHF